MNRFLSYLILSVFLSLPSLVQSAPVETFKFDSPETEKVFHKLSEELRCLVCQNQNIAESNAGLAKDLRLEIYTMLQAGKTEDEIVAFMVQRYGDYVLYRPPFKPLTWLLWLGPLIVFIFGLIFAVRYMKAESIKTQPAELSEADLERVKSLHADLSKQQGEK